MDLRGKNDFLRLGDWKAVCDVCGVVFHGSELRRRWDGFMVCSDDYEQRHPQDLIRLRPERTSLPWARPYPTDTFRTPAPADGSNL